jgi:hypothetical protein
VLAMFRRLKMVQLLERAANVHSYIKQRKVNSQLITIAVNL